MSDSPQSPSRDAEHGAQSPDGDDNQMDNQRDQDASLGYADFEIKEQDRWLPIANGEYSARWASVLVIVVPCLLVLCGFLYSLCICCCAAQPVQSTDLDRNHVRQQLAWCGGDDWLIRLREGTEAAGSRC
jgi:hypothetical protein